MYTDQTLNCRDCGKQFTWTASEQEFFASKGFSTPVRCQDCRNRKKQGGDTGGPRAPRTMHEITCANCGSKGEVPFAPRDPGNVLCADCFRAKRDAERGIAPAQADSNLDSNADETVPAAEVTDNGNDSNE